MFKRQKTLSNRSSGAVSDPDNVLFRGAGVEIGLFDCPRHHPQFVDSGPVSGDLVVFPGHAVGISHGRGDDIVASRQVITLYNAGQEYRRRPLSDYGDRSIWLKFERHLVVEALEAAGLAVPGTDKRPFRWTWSRCSHATFLAHRRLLRALLANDGTDWRGEFSAIPETAFTLLAAAIDSVPDSTASLPDSATARRHRLLARRCQERLETGFMDGLSLESLARELATTPYHLSRVFKRHLGQSIHAYLVQLRLRAALDFMIEQPDRRLTDLGLDLGFATPSHFSHAFGKRFQITPRQFLRGDAPGQLSKNLTVSACERI